MWEQCSIHNLNLLPYRNCNYGQGLCWKKKYKNRIFLFCQYKFKNLLAWPKCDFINFAGTNETLLAIAQLLYKLLYVTALHYYPGCGRASCGCSKVLEGIHSDGVPISGPRETIVYKMSCVLRHTRVGFEPSTLWIQDKNHYTSHHSAATYSFPLPMASGFLFTYVMAKCINQNVV